MAEKEVKKGYTGFSNELVNDPIIKNSKAWTLFSYCLFKAYFDDKYGEAGTFTTTQIEIASHLGWGYKTVIKFMKFLKIISILITKLLVKIQ
jgi:hypothetical protein